MLAVGAIGPAGLILLEDLYDLADLAEATQRTFPRRHWVEEFAQEDADMPTAFNI